MTTAKTSTASATGLAESLILEGLTPTDVEALLLPFPEDVVGYRIGSYNRETGKKEILGYAPWGEYVKRLYAIDSSWEYGIEDPKVELLGSGQYGQKYGFTVKAVLTIKGVTREAIAAGLGEPGERFDPFEMTIMGAESDALKRAAAKFGMGLQFYEKKLMTKDEAEAKAGEGRSSGGGQRTQGAAAGPRPASTGGGGSGFQMNPAQKKRAFAIARDVGFDGDDPVAEYIESIFPGAGKTQDSNFNRAEMDELLSHEFGAR